MKIKKSCILLVMALLLCLCTSVSAAESIDLDKTGSITVTMRCEDQPVSGGTLTLYHVATLVPANGTYGFAFTEAFEDCTLSVEDIRISTDAAANYATYIEDHSIQGIKKAVDTEGEASFADLPLGLYLIVQEQPAEDYCAVLPFLVTVPVEAQDAWTYDVTAAPKVEVDHDPDPSDPDIPSNPDTPSDPDTPSEPSTPGIPQTGQLKWPIPVLAISGLLVFSVGWALCFVKRKTTK